mmetsp:Transcript_61073/g.157492  ORF Transcript_61073/g.157492 Transcript_61073/m.157492 type:complete len:351 (-) Transcript_61073:510-1562(-)
MFAGGIRGIINQDFPRPRVVVHELPQIERLCAHRTTARPLTRLCGELLQGGHGVRLGLAAVNLVDGDEVVDSMPRRGVVLEPHANHAARLRQLVEDGHGEGVEVRRGQAAGPVTVGVVQDRCRRLQVVPEANCNLWVRGHPPEHTHGNFADPHREGDGGVGPWELGDGLGVCGPVQHLCDGVLLARVGAEGVVALMRGGKVPRPHALPHLAVASEVPEAAQPGPRDAGVRNVGVVKVERCRALLIHQKAAALSIVALSRSRNHRTARLRVGAQQEPNRLPIVIVPGQVPERQQRIDAGHSVVLHRVGPGVHLDDVLDARVAPHLTTVAGRVRQPRQGSNGCRAADALAGL